MTRYVIRGGVEGRERLRIVSRVMRPSTNALLERAGIRPGMKCLDVGCGGGDVAFDLARAVTATGRVIGTDIDEVKLSIARREAAAHQLPQVEFRVADVARDQLEPECDLVHARFLLTHLTNPEAAVARMWQAVRPGGVVVLEDVDFRGYFSHPDCPAVWRYVDLYTRSVARRGGDANIGPRLPDLLAGAGFEDVQMNVVQHAGIAGEVKLISPITMENIADAVIAEGLATQGEVDTIVAEMYEHALTPGTIGCTPRIVEAWATRPS